MRQDTARLSRAYLTDILNRLKHKRNENTGTLLLIERLVTKCPFSIVYGIITAYDTIDIIIYKNIADGQ